MRAFELELVSELGGDLVCANFHFVAIKVFVLVLPSPVIIEPVLRKIMFKDEAHLCCVSERNLVLLGATCAAANCVTQ
jgi:hypothetical protein